MKIFATADVHGNQVIIDKLNQAAKSCDLILVCGDIGYKIGCKEDKDYEKHKILLRPEKLPTADFLMEFSTNQRKDAEYLSDLIKNLPIPARFILGNDDWYEFSGAGYLENPEAIGGFDFIPFEFVKMSPFNTNREVNENKLLYELAKLKVSDKSIIVAHTPPFSCGDKIYSGERIGSKSAYCWIEQRQPLVWICGHIHEDNSIHEIGKTKVFNCACDHNNEDVLHGWMINLDTLDYERFRL